MTKQVNNRAVGLQDLPDEVWIDSLDDALFIIQKETRAADFEELVFLTESLCPPLLTYLERCPLRVLSLQDEWDKILSVALWIFHHPNPGIYLRQIDLPGIHTKFIEGRQSVLTELLHTLTLHGAKSDISEPGKSFAERFGFLSPSPTIRFRLPLDASEFPAALSDISLSLSEFSLLDLPCANVLVVENKTNFLSLPRTHGTLIIWGEGYGATRLSQASWLASKKIFYWGDIDTHGFAILSGFRSIFPQTESFLMDTETLLQYRDLWGDEPSPTVGDLPCLTAEEASLYLDLVDNKYGKHVRLEQERVGYGKVTDTLRSLLARDDEGKN